MSSRYAVRLVQRSARGDAMADRVLYQPLPKQEVLHAATEPNILFGGAAGGSKSHGLRWHGIIACLQHRQIRVLFLRRQFTELEQTHLLALPLEVPRELARYDSVRHRLVFARQQSILQFGHCNTDKDFEQYLSTEWDLILVDEASQFTPRQLRLLRTRLRTTKQTVRPQFVCASNPGGDGHLWLKQRFISREVDPEEEPNYNPEQYRFILSRVQDNPYLTADYIARLEGLPEAERRAYLEGDWDVFAGQYFAEWRRAMHTVQSFDIPDEWEVEGGMDWGFDPNPGVLELGAFDPHGRVWVYAEFKFLKLPPQDVAAQIVERFKSDKERRMLIRGDPSMWAKGSADYKAGTSIADEMNATFAALGSEIVLIRADNDRLGGWARVHQYLYPNRKQPDNLGRGPWLRVFRPGSIGAKRLGGARYLIETLPAQVHDDKQSGDLKKGPTDHACDALRYLLMAHAPLTITLEEESEGPVPGAHEARVRARTTELLAKVRRRQNRATEATIEMGDGGEDRELAEGDEGADVVGDAFN